MLFFISDPLFIIMIKKLILLIYLAYLVVESHLEAINLLIGVMHVIRLRLVATQALDPSLIGIFLLAI